MTEQQVTDLLDRATTDLRTDSDLVAGAVRRGRGRRRRHRAVSCVAAVAVLGAVAAGASLLSDATAPATVLDRELATAGVDPADDPGDDTGPLAQPSTPDRPITVAGRDVPATIASFLPPGELGPILQDHPYPFVTDSQPDGAERIVHFRYQGALVTFVIERSEARSRAEELAAADPVEERLTSRDGVEPPQREPGEIRLVDGLQVWVAPTYPTLQVQTNGVSVWNHGYIVGLTAYNAAGGKNPDGSEDVTPLFDEPVIDTDTLIEIAASEVWFE